MPKATETAICRSRLLSAPRGDAARRRRVSDFAALTAPEFKRSRTAVSAAVVNRSELEGCIAATRCVASAAPMAGGEQRRAAWRCSLWVVV